jgi:hypothetical protein
VLLLFYEKRRIDIDLGWLVGRPYKNAIGLRSNIPGLAIASSTVSSRMHTSKGQSRTTPRRNGHGQWIMDILS